MDGSISSCSPSNKTEDIKGQEEYGKGSEGDKEQHDSKTPPSPDGQTGLKHTNIKKFNTLCAYHTWTSLKIRDRHNVKAFTSSIVKHTKQN